MLHLKGFLTGLSCAALVGSLAAVAKPKSDPKPVRSYLAVWSSDKETDDNHLDPDFLAIIDADPGSATYGKVLSTAAIQNIPNTNLLNDLGLTSGLPSNVLNEAHHMTHDPIVDGGRSYLFVGGLISANIFKCDVTNPLAIPTCPLITRAAQVQSFSGIDDFIQEANGNLLVTYMGAKNLTTPGGVVELDVNGNVLNEFAAARSGGPIRYIPSIHDATDTGLLAHPHGIDLRSDLNLVVSSDYADPLSLALSTSASAPTEDLGTTVRFWNASSLASGPYAISQLPVGVGLEANPIQNSPEGVMSVALTHLHAHRGAFAATMMGGSLYYTADATAAHPVFKEIFRVGPGAGASVFIITPDDRYLILPISGIQSPGDPVFDRDYVGEHSRRLISLDIQSLLAAGTDISCSSPAAVLNEAGIVQKIDGHNNGAADCPKVAGVLNLDSPVNFTTHGGPHFIAVDHESRRIAIDNYFVQLTPFGLPGTGSAGDDRICMATLELSGKLVLDKAFRDELTGRTCVDMDRPTSYSWPNRGTTGAAKPHMMAFVNLD